MGPQYGSSRVLVLGESWYGDYEGDLVTDAGYIAAYLADQQVDRMYSKMANASGLGKKRFWELVAFTNFVQRVGDTLNCRPTRQQYLDAQDRLRRVLSELKPKGVLPTRPVFWYAWPTYDILCSDFKRPGIERVDGLGRVLHFHSFRKTWQAFGVRFGVNQRAAQEILGYSDLSSTANVSTDVPALSLHSEIAKLPWITEGGERLESVSHLMSQKGEKMPAEPSLPEILLQLRKVCKVFGFRQKQTRLHWWKPGLNLKNGCPGWDRTSDQVINSHLLYR